ncbi:hypothetical protein BC941DRAFT_432953 [Chlamydoabsidia padenii]|nr:hypothetical protein BC941DRAFT_432953 [Chlamydoabsidia padenii]
MSSLPKCHCGVICLSKEAYKGDNRGRWYWVCATSRCRFFTWNDNGDTLYEPIIHKPIGPTVKNQHLSHSTATVVKPDAIPTRPEPSTFVVNDNEYPLVARKSRLANPRRIDTTTTNNKKKTVIQLALYTDTDICIHAEDRHRYLQTLLNAFPWVSWYEQNHMWVFPAAKDAYSLVWNLMRQNRATFEVTGVPNAVLRLLPNTRAQLMQQQTTLQDTSLDWMGSWFQQEVITGSKLWKSMTADQRMKMKKGANLSGHIYLQDSIGSGRSLQALGVALVHQDKWPALIVCRSSAFMVWKKLIQDMLSLKRHDICIMDSLPAYNGNVYSDNVKAVKSRVYRRQQRELLRQQKGHLIDQQQDRILSSASSTMSSTPSVSTLISSSSTDTSLSSLPPLSPSDVISLDPLSEDMEMSWCINLKNDSGDRYKPKRKRSTTTIESKDNPTKKRSYNEMDSYTNVKYNNDDDGSDLEEGLGWSNSIISDENDNMDDDDGGDQDMEAPIWNDTGEGMNDEDEEGQLFNQAIFSTAQFFLISYEKAKTRLRTLGAKKFKVVIFDDCHDIKRTMLPTFRSSLQRFVNGTDKTIMVSGDSVLTHPFQSFPLLRVLRPNLFVDYKYFGYRYCGAKHLVFGWDYRGTSNHHELEYLLDRTLLVR